MGRERVPSVMMDEPAPERLVDRVLRRRRRSARLGPGTGRVTCQLARLTRKGSRWHDVHGVPVGTDGAPAEHLLIGPGGVFVVGVRVHPHARVWVRGNVLRVDGEPHAYVSDARHEALRASRCLTAACGFSVPVAGVVVVGGAEDVVVREAPGDVHVLSRQQLRSWLRRQREVQDRATVAAIHTAALTVTTWTAHH